MSLLNEWQKSPSSIMPVICWRCDAPMRIKTIAPTISSAPLDEIVYLCSACNLERKRIVQRGDQRRPPQLAERVMAVPRNDKHKDYVRYAEHCLKMVPAAADQEYQAVQREMAVAWLKLADAALHPSKRMD
jgi:hypothetical protein